MTIDDYPPDDVKDVKISTAQIASIRTAMESQQATYAADNKLERQQLLAYEDKWFERPTKLECGAPPTREHKLEFLQKGVAYYASKEMFLHAAKLLQHMDTLQGHDKLETYYESSLKDDLVKHIKMIRKEYDEY